MGSGNGSAPGDGSPKRIGGRTPLLVLVVGETARSKNFSLNGYARDTNPELARRDVLSWRNAYSCGTSTRESVPCMFSHLGRTGFYKSKVDYDNLVDVLYNAGLAVLWLDNQAGCKGVCDRIPNASTADRLDTPDGKALCSSDGECLDGILLSGIDERIAALPRERRERTKKSQPRAKAQERMKAAAAAAEAPAAEGEAKEAAAS